ncbi:MAG: cytochrome P450 [Micromonosporaceae bacterium]
MAVVASRSARFDIRDPAVLADPYPTYASLRAYGPLVSGGPGQWLVPRYADVAALLKDSRLTKNLPEAYYRFTVGDAKLAAFLARMNLGHRNRLASRVLVKVFSPGLVRRLGDHMREMVDELLAPGLDSGELDAINDLALPLPIRVICELLGVPEEERGVVWPHAAALIRVFSDVAFLSEKPEGEIAAASDALGWLREYLCALLDRRRGGDGQDLLTSMLAASDGGERLTDDEIADNAITVLYAGFETSMGMVGNGVAELLRNPGELDRLRADPGLVPGAVEEVLRYEAPIQVTMRSPLEPFEFGGRTMRPGRVLFLLLGSANRDPARFDEPDRFDIGRAPNPHLSFGSGIYHCIGAALARAEGHAVLHGLISRCGTIELAAEPVRRPRFNFRTYDRLPLTIRPA